jgi:hypothetical protein
MQRIKKITPFILYFLIAQILLLIANSHLLILAHKTPPNTHFTWNHIAYNSMDHNVYLSVMTQGANGDWLMRDAYTTEPTNGTFFYFFYILLGKLGKIFSLSPDITYLIAKIVGSELLIISVYVVAPKYAFLAGIFALSVTAWPTQVAGQESRPWVPWWFQFEAMGRLDIMPHYSISWAILTFGVKLLTKFIKSAKPKIIILLGPMIVISGLFLPSSVLPFAAFFPLGWLMVLILTSLQKRKMSLSPKVTIGILFLMVFSAIPILLMVRERWNGFPWDAWYKWDDDLWNHVSSFNHDMIYLFGILPILAIPGIVYVFWKNKPIYILLAVWAVLPYLLLPIAGVIGTSKYRLLSTAPFIPLSVLAAYSLSLIPRIKGDLILKIMIAIIIIATFIPTSYVYIKYMDNNANKYPTYTNIYIPSDYWHLLTYLNTKVPKNSVIVSDWVGGNLMAGFAPIIAFAGHPVHTENFFDKTPLYTNFFQKTMTSDETKKFLTDYRVDYVMYGPIERNMNPAFSSPYLTQVFAENNYMLYKVNK